MFYTRGYEVLFLYFRWQEKRIVHHLANTYCISLNNAFGLHRLFFITLRRQHIAQPETDNTGGNHGYAFSPMVGLCIPFWYLQRMILFVAHFLRHGDDIFISQFHNISIDALG